MTRANAPRYLYRLDREQAEYLMMSVAVAGGWIDTHADSREAVVDCVGVGRADYLSLWPEGWDPPVPTRGVSATLAQEILTSLIRRSRYSVVGEEDIAAAAADRLRALLEVSR